MVLRWKCSEVLAMHFTPINILLIETNIYVFRFAKKTINKQLSCWEVSSQISSSNSTILRKSVNSKFLEEYKISCINQKLLNTIRANGTATSEHNLPTSMLCVFFQIFFTKRKLPTWYSHKISTVVTWILIIESVHQVASC